MELLIEEQDHLITESYNLDSGDALRFSIVHESFIDAHKNYQRTIAEYSENSRQAQVAESKLKAYTKLYNDFVTEMDNHYLVEK